MRVRLNPALCLSVPKAGGVEWTAQSEDSFHRCSIYNWHFEILSLFMDKCITGKLAKLWQKPRLVVYFYIWRGDYFLRFSPYFPLFGGVYISIFRRCCTAASLLNRDTVHDAHLCTYEKKRAWDQEYIHVNVTQNFKKTPWGFIHNLSLMCLMNCSSHSQHLSPNTLWFLCGPQHRPTLNDYYLFTGPSLDDLASGLQCRALEEFIRDHLSLFAEFLFQGSWSKKLSSVLNP